MSKSRPPRNRSARAARLARQAAALRSRGQGQAAGRPLAAMSLPYLGYQQWYTPLGDVPAEGDVSGAAREVHAAIVRLAPQYGGKVPLAALYLDQQIRAGTLRLAQEGDAAVSAVAVPDMATVLTATARVFGDLEDPDAGDADTGMLLHELHALGALFLDDRRAIRLADLV